MFELLDGRPSAYQWDTGLYVDCTGLKETDQVHFCRPGQVLAIRPAMQGETLAAPVPDELLQQAQPIIVYAFAQTATGEVTKVSARLCVTARPKPPGYIASTTEALRWENLQEQIGELSEEISDCIKTPTAAEVGQTIVVKAIGDDGKPTEWESVTLPKYVQPDWTQNDPAAADYVKNRPFYEAHEWVDVVASTVPVEIDLTMPNVGETITIKINGVKTEYAVQTAESTIFGLEYNYVGSNDLDSMINGGSGWCIAAANGFVSAIANPDTTISYITQVAHKIPNKFLDTEQFVRNINYLYSGAEYYKSLFDRYGTHCSMYVCEEIKYPNTDELLLGRFDSLDSIFCVEYVKDNAVFLSRYSFGASSTSNKVTVGYSNLIIGTDVKHMEELASENGFTYTAAPTAS